MSLHNQTKGELSLYYTQKGYVDIAISGSSLRREEDV